MITLNGPILSNWQRCKRPYIISQTHTFDKWRPQSLLSAVLRHAVFELSNGGNLEQITSIAVNNFLREAKQPGLDIPQGVNSYTLAMDFVAIIRNFLEYLSRLSLLTLRHVPSLQVSPSVTWSFISHQDESGVLHRWKFVDYIPEDILPELHSWEVFGDIAAGDAPMTLHLVAIGKRNKHHQDSPWSRTYAHPKLPKIYRFQKKSANGLEGNWSPVYFSGNTENNPKQWVDLMERDNVLPTVVQHIRVKEVSAEHRKTFFKDVNAETLSILATAGMDPRDIPLSRYACDHPYTCPHQLFCYSSLSLDKVGIYKKLEKKDGKLVSAC